MGVAQLSAQPPSVGMRNRSITGSLLPLFEDNSFNLSTLTLSFASDELYNCARISGLAPLHCHSIEALLLHTWRLAV